MLERGACLSWKDPPIPQVGDEMHTTPGDSLAGYCWFGDELQTALPGTWIKVVSYLTAPAKHWCGLAIHTNNITSPESQSIQQVINPCDLQAYPNSFLFKMSQRPSHQSVAGLPLSSQDASYTYIDSVTFIADGLRMVFHLINKLRRGRMAIPIINDAQILWSS